VLPRDEEQQPTTQESMFNYVRMSDGGPLRHDGPRSEVDVISTIAAMVFEDDGPSSVGHSLLAGYPLGGSSPLDWSAMRSTAQIRQTIARIVPGFEQLADIDATKQEFQIGGRTFHEPRFATPDGRARLHTHELPVLQADANDEIRLMTLRSEGQFNTVVYEDEDTYRGMDRRDVIMLHPVDLARFGLTDGMRVTVRGPGGTMHGIRATEFANVKPGNAAMYYPEANVLIGRTIDPLSRTPAFKNTVIRVEATSRCSHEPASEPAGQSV
jgi:anaerobic selenocysteine-containing dehydrogenase